MDKSAEAVEHGKRVVQHALDRGVLSKTRRLHATHLQPSKLVLKADGKDIVKKNSSRKGRYLLNISCKIAPAAAGKLGSLAKLDSRNPVLYIDFPEGRLKFFGTLVFPRTKYMVLKFGPREAVVEEVFENMVVFSEAWWIGTKAENPEERQLPMPDNLKTEKHSKYSFSVREQAETEKGQIAGNTLEKKDGDSALDQLSPPPEDQHRDSSQQEAASQRPSRRNAGKRPRYAISSSDDDGDDATDEEESVEVLPKKPIVSPRNAAKQIPRPEAAKQNNSAKAQLPAGGKQVAISTFFTKKSTKNLNQSPALRRAPLRAAAAEVVNCITESDEEELTISQDVVKQTRPRASKGVKAAGSDPDTIMEIEDGSSDAQEDSEDEDFEL